MPSLFIALSSSQPSFAGEWHSYAALHSFSYSEPVSIHAALNDWQSGDFRRGERQWSEQYVEVGRQYRDWQLALLARLDMALQFSSDTAEFYYRVENDLPLDLDREQRLHLSAQRYRLSGLRGGRQLQLTDQLAINLGLSLFHADQLIDGTIDGSQEHLQLNYHYSEDALLDRQVSQPGGWGASLDLTLQWQPGPDQDVQMQVTDLLGAIWWRDAPYTIASATADQQTYDEAGRLTIAPLASGYEGISRHYQQNLSPRWRLDSRSRYAGYDLYASGYARADSRLLAVGLGRDLAFAQQLGVRFWSGINTLEVFGRYRDWQLSVASDSLNSKDAHSLWLTLSYRPAMTSLQRELPQPF